MEYMSAWKLLGGDIRSFLCLVRNVCVIHGRSSLIIRRCDHLVAANDASPVGHSRQFLFSSVGISTIHVTSCIVISDEGFQASDEGTSREVDIPDNVQRETIESQDDEEERQICCKLHEI